MFQKVHFNPGNKTDVTAFMAFVLNNQSKGSSINEEYYLKIRNNHIDIYLIQLLWKSNVILHINCLNGMSHIVKCSTLQIISVCSSKNWVGLRDTKTYTIGILQSCWPLCDPTDCSTPGFHDQFPELAQTPIKSVMPSNHLILCHPLLLLPSILPSIRSFSNESVLHIKWPKYSSFSFSISPSNDYSVLISFRIDWFDLLAVKRALKSLL